MRQLFKTVTVTTGEDETKNFFLDYYVLEKKIKIENQYVNRFGIEVYKRARRDDGTPYVEYRKIFDVFGTEAEALEVLDLMARNTVTPISMLEILEDLLGVREFAGEALFVEAV